MGLFTSREPAHTAVMKSPLPLGIKSATHLCNAVVGIDAGPSSRALTRTPSPRRSSTSASSNILNVPRTASPLPNPSPLERVPTEIVIERPPRPPPPKQPTREELARDGIKVKDFAFEKSSIAPLPHVPVVRRYFSRALKRTRDQTDFGFVDRENRQRDEKRSRGNEFAGTRLLDWRETASSSSRALSAHPSWRESDGPPPPMTTTPSYSRYSIFAALSSAFSSSQPRRLKLCTPSSSNNNNNNLSPRHTSTYNHLSQSFDPESQSSSTGTSQLPNLSISQSSERSEELIKTPIVTPNGSLIFDHNNDNEDFDDDDRGSGSGRDRTMDILDTSSLPESQIERIHHSADGSGDIPDLGSQPTWQPPTTEESMGSGAGGGVSSRTTTSSDVRPSTTTTEGEDEDVSSEFEKEVIASVSTKKPSSNLMLMSHPHSSESVDKDNHRHGTLAALLTPARGAKQLDRSLGRDGGALFGGSSEPQAGKRYSLRKRRASSPITVHKPTPITPQRGSEVSDRDGTAYRTKLRSHSPPKPVQQRQNKKRGFSSVESDSKDELQTSPERGRSKRARVSLSSDKAAPSSTTTTASHTRENEMVLRRSPRKKR